MYVSSGRKRAFSKIRAFYIDKTMILGNTRDSPKTITLF